MSLIAAFALRMLGSNLVSRVSFWERGLLGRGDKRKRARDNGKGKNRNYLQFPIESNRKLKILKFISFLSFLVILRGLTSFFVKIIFRARRIRLSLLIPWKEQRNMLKIWQSSKEIIVFCLLQMFRWNQISTDHLMHRPMVLGLLRHRFERLQHCSIIWTLCCTMLRLKMPQRRRQRERQKKAVGWIGKTTTLHLQHAFFTFLCRRCTTTT